MLVIGAAQAIVMIAGRPRHSPLDDDAVTVAAGAMTRRAENSEALASAFEQCRCQDRLVRDGPIALGIIPCHGARRRIPQHTAAKRRRLRILAVFRLHLHVLLARGQADRRQYQEWNCPAHRFTNSTDEAPSSRRKVGVRFSSNAP